jgi:DNA (cytosine-5)-methyltransferase 1
MQFIDLFAGLGGFNLALKKLGHECVFACEINKPLADLYKSNFNIDVKGDIRKIKAPEIPSHDILCAGFPCQPFSKAGKQKGRKDKKNGNLFKYIVKILDYHKPQYFILENVPFIKQHDNEKTWKYMVSRLQKKLDYKIDHRVYSPHEFGIPQHRKRIFIVGAKDGLSHFSWPSPNHKPVSIKSILDKNPKSAKKVDKEELGCLKLWQNFINRIPKEDKLPGFPVWSMEFGATYPFEKTTPHALTSDELSEYLGRYGVSLKGLSKEEQLKLLPSYARTKQKKFPEWKQDFIRRNREFYNKYKKQVDPVVRKIKRLKQPSWQKFEWNCQDSERVIKNYLIQFRASGIRVKKTNFSPSLVCTRTQVPIIGWEKRYISKREGARLQSLNGIKLPKNDNECFRALGNAVNVHIVNLIADSLIK